MGKYDWSRKPAGLLRWQKRLSILATHSLWFPTFRGLHVQMHLSTFLLGIDHFGVELEFQTLFGEDLLEVFAIVKSKRTTCKCA